MHGWHANSQLLPVGVSTAVRCWLCASQHTSANRRLNLLSRYLFSLFLQVSGVTLVESGQAVKYSTEIMFSTDKFEIV